MDLIAPGLYATAPRPLPFARTIAMRSFLCQREEGNLLIHASGDLAAEAAEIERLGGVSRLYLNHWHEAEFDPRLPDVTTFIHADDGDAMPAQATFETFSERHLVGDDFEVIPAPGHTPGATVYRWDSGEQRVLFSGDTIFLRDDRWVTAVLDSSDRASYAASLELIRDLEFDLLAPWASSGGAAVAATDSADARRRIDELLERLG